MLNAHLDQATMKLILSSKEDLNNIEEMENNTIIKMNLNTLM